MSLGLHSVVTTLALGALALVYLLGQASPHRPGPRPPARTAATARLTPAPRVTTAREILDRRLPLALTAGQVARLEALDRQWQEESAELDTAVRAASQDFSRFMAEARAPTGASLDEIRRRAADIGELSAALRERRQAHGEAAARLLTDTQRRDLHPAPSPLGFGGDE